MGTETLKYRDYLSYIGISQNQVTKSSYIEGSQFAKSVTLEGVAKQVNFIRWVDKEWKTLEV